jgi:hypothetical protein
MDSLITTALLSGGVIVSYVLLVAILIWLDLL